jgi:hypothetical protein
MYSIKNSNLNLNLAFWWLKTFVHVPKPDSKLYHLMTFNSCSSCCMCLEHHWGCCTFSRQPCCRKVIVHWAKASVAVLVSVIHCKYGLYLGLFCLAGSSHSITSRYWYVKLPPTTWTTYLGDNVDPTNKLNYTNILVMTQWRCTLRCVLDCVMSKVLSLSSKYNRV